MSRGKAKRRASLCVGVAALWLGCTTPSVPIPPPEPEKVIFALDVDAGEARFQYDAEASYGGAIVYVFNRDLGEGIITTARDDGSVGPTAPIPAQVDNEIVITFETETQLSATCVRMRDGRSDSGQECQP